MTGLEGIVSETGPLGLKIALSWTAEHIKPKEEAFLGDKKE
jgi:hypothetical protein